MNTPRELMDRMTSLVFIDRDMKAFSECYTEDAVLVTPDEGELQGREAIAGYMQQFVSAFPDARYEPTHGYESADGAVDEGFFVGTNTAPLALGTGESLPATGKQVRVRACDAITVEGDLVKEHRTYFDLLDMLTQLGVSPEAALA